MGYRIRKHLRSRWIVTAVATGVALCIGGCGDFVTDKTAGIESNRILKDLGRIKTTPDANVPLPDIYRQPPKVVKQIVGGAEEWKLFYVCKHHTSDDMRNIVNTHYATKLFNQKGQSTTIKDYNVSSIRATNQLIVRCPKKEDIEAVLEFLELTDIPPIQVKIDCLISEVYADKTLDWETSIMVTNLLGEDIWAGPAGRPFGEAISSLVEEGPTIAAFPGASLREIARSKMGLKVGYWSEKHNFMALVDLLESQGYLKILMNPTLEVVNGKMAKVLSSQMVPLQQTYLTNPNQDWFQTRTEYEDVVDSLQITPHVFADSIGLETSILLGSKLTPEGIKQISIITKKQIDNKESRIRFGESLVIGGIRKSEKRDVVRGIPFLKDIPLIGMLFSGRDFEERAVETIFILTPSISTGGIPSREMTKELERRHEPSSFVGMREAITDPFGLQARERELQRGVYDAEQARLEAEAEKAVARSAVRAADYKAQRAEADAAMALVELRKVKAEAEQVKAAAEKAMADAEAKSKAATEAKAVADKASAEAAAAKTAAQKVAADAGKTKAEAEKAMAQAAAKVKAAEAAKTAADKAAAEAAVAKAQAEKMVAEAEQKKMEAEKMAAEAEQKKAEAQRIAAGGQPRETGPVDTATEPQKSKDDAATSTVTPETPQASGPQAKELRRDKADPKA
ncbi:MAG: type II and III secretion system protein [Phycisphaerales bacterium]|nr:MAG: type II and III secretion system protein [Phycisphaerales bacterium]